MASLKDLRTRISSVKSTQRITSAMKMVAAAKLKRAQESAEASRPYAERMERMLASLSANAQEGNSPPMLSGTGKDDVQLIVLVTSDRGLCGGFNASLLRYVRQRITRLQGDGKTVKLIPIGRKGSGILRRDYRSLYADAYEELSKPVPSFEGAAKVAARVTELFEAGEFDTCTIVYNKFVSALTQEVTPLQLIPFKPPSQDEPDEEDESRGTPAVYEFEPEEEEILADLLPKNLSVQIYRAMIESFASEQGARMAAMDSATRNAGDMINRLSITYNRQRQAQITKELIEIISGAEAL